MQSRTLVAILFLAAVSLISAIVIAATDTVSVNVTIQSVSQITVVPDSLNWTNLQPASTGGVINLTIKNTGSANLTDVFAYVNTNETELNRPYGSSNPANFSSGGMLVISNSTNTRFYWGQKKEWNWSISIPNIDLSAIGSSSRSGYGFLRNTSFEYVWAVGNGTNTSTGSGLCNQTNALFAIEDDVDQGTTPTRTPTTTGITRDGGDTEYSYFSVNRATSPISGMCVAVRFDCSYILVYKYDRRSGYQTCVNAMHMRAADLAPGFTDNMYADAWIPSGVPSGQLAVATMTVQAT